MSGEHATYETREATEVEQEAELPGAPVPGLILVFSQRDPKLTAIPLASGEAVLGRGDSGPVQIADACMSRKHAMVRYDGEHFAVQDLDSRNGTAVDGEPLRPHTWQRIGRIVRMGDSLFMPVADVRRWLGAEVVRTHDGRILGPSLQRVLDAIGRLAGFGSTLHVTGESGAGKESAARAFHDLGPCPSGPFVAVNCAAIPEGIAERLLFGARRGAYSGAASDAEGVVQAADGGTLFLDEIGDLHPAVQGKLLRVIENREVVPLGATRPVPVSVRFCSATHKDLRALVAAGTLRQDLYFRIARPEVAVPPLRERLEEIPWLIAAALERLNAGLWPHVSLVEACLVRPWPGNIRELLSEIQVAGQQAIASDAQKVQSHHLSPRAGLAFSESVSQPGDSTGSRKAVSASPPSSIPPASMPPDSASTTLPSEQSEQGIDLKSPAARGTLEAILRRTGGNVTEAARVLGIHRTQLRRLLAHHQIDPRRFPRLPEEPPSDTGP